MALSRDRADGAESPSTRQLIARALDQTSVIIRQEIALAKAEFAEKARRAAFGVACAALAAVAAFTALLCAVAAAVDGLAGVIPAWAAALVLAGVLAAGAGAGGLIGLRAFVRAAPAAPPDVLAGVRADVTEIKEQLQR